MDLYNGAIFLIVLVGSLCVHEWAHAWAAHRLGDDTAKHQGRLTLNPIPHLDPIGSIAIPVVLMLSGATLFFAWAKPVPFDPRNFKNARNGEIIVALAGPASNLLICLVVAVIGGIAIRFDAGLAGLVGIVILVNSLLAVFNLIPVPPLDGSHVLRHLVGMSNETYMRFSQYGFLILIGLLFLVPPFRYALGVAIHTVADPFVRLTLAIAGG